MELAKRNFTKILPKISQGPIDDPEIEGSKALTRLKDNKGGNFDYNKNDVVVVKENRFFINPESYKKLTWDIVCMTLIIYLAITVPYKICFNVAANLAWSYFEAFVTIFFMFDIFVCFNTGFYSKGALVTNRKSIALNYLKLWFWIDLFSSIPYSWFTDGVIEIQPNDSTGISQTSKLLKLIRFVRFLKVLRLLRLAKLKRILMKIEDYIASNMIATLFVFLKLLSVVFFIAHWTACWWYYIGSQDMDNYPVTWVVRAGIENKSDSEKYITALYWAFTTMTTVGYGDIVANTVNEKIYAMFSMILACGVFAYTVGSIGSLVSKQNAMENAYREQVVAVNRYMRKKELPYDLQFRVRRYLEYVWENKKKNNLDEKQILKLLSEPLRDEIYAQIHGDIIKKCKIFSKNSFESHFLNQVTRTLESETYAPGDTVIEEGEMSTKMYFIQNGKVDIFHHSTKSTFKELKNGDYFGEIAFFTERPRCASAKCLDFVDLLSLSRHSMNEILERFPEAKKKVSELSKSCEGDDFTTLFVKCYVCKGKGHFAIKCKKILLNLDHEETKKTWLNKRTNAFLKTVKPDQENPPNYQRAQRKRIQIPVSLRSVIGIKKNSENVFPENQDLNSKLINYASRHSVNDENFGKYELQRPFPANRPKYTLIYKDSEGSVEGQDEASEDEKVDSDEDKLSDRYRKFNDSNLESPNEISSNESRARDNQEKLFIDAVHRIKDLDIKDFSLEEKDSSMNSLDASYNLLIPPKGSS